MAGILLLIPFYTSCGQFYEGVSKTSFERFGWTSYGWITEGYPLSKGAERYCEELRDGTLANLIKENFCVSRSLCDFYFIRRETLQKVEVVQCNWVFKTIKATYPEFYYYLTYSIVNPGILIESNNSILTLYKSCFFLIPLFLMSLAMHSIFLKVSQWSDQRPVIIKGTRMAICLLTGYYCGIRMVK